MIIHDYVMGMYISMNDNDFKETLTCANRLLKSKHHREVTINDLTELFGFQRTMIGDYYLIDREKGILISAIANGICDLMYGCWFPRLPGIES